MSGLDLPRRGVATALGRWCRDERVAYHRLADTVGMSRRALVRVVTGTRPPMRYAVALAAATGLPLDAVIVGERRGSRP